MIKCVLTGVAAVAGIFAAGLWLFASFQKVDFDPNEMDEAGWHPYAQTKQVGKRTIDVLKTADRQTRWNWWAALAALIAAVCGVLLLF